MPCVPFVSHALFHPGASALLRGQVPPDIHKGGQHGAVGFAQGLCVVPVHAQKHLVAGFHPVQRFYRIAAVHDALRHLPVLVQRLRNAGHLLHPLIDPGCGVGVLKLFALRQAQAVEQFPPEKLIAHGLIHADDQPVVDLLLRDDLIVLGRIPALIDLAVFVRERKAVQYHVRTGLFRCAVGLFQRLRQQHIVRIHKGNPFALCRVQPGIAGAAQAAVLLVDDPDAAVLCRCGIAQSRAAVRGAVVHQNQLKIRKGLGKDGIDAVIQVFFHPVHRHDDADLRTHFFFLCIHSSFSINSNALFYNRTVHK